VHAKSVAAGLVLDNLERFDLGMLHVAEEGAHPVLQASAHGVVLPPEKGRLGEPDRLVEREPGAAVVLGYEGWREAILCEVEEVVDLALGEEVVDVDGERIDGEKLD
jgi:hypothetical protein